MVVSPSVAADVKVEYFRRATLSPLGDRFSTFNNYWDASFLQISIHIVESDVANGCNGVPAEKIDKQ